MTRDSIPWVGAAALCCAVNDDDRSPFRICASHMARIVRIGHSPERHTPWSESTAGPSATTNKGEGMDRLVEIEQRAKNASPGEWQASIGANAEGTEYVTTKEAKADFLALSLNDDASNLWLVVSPDVIPAATGDGPNAKNNAEFIAHAPSDIAYLLGIVRAQQAALSAVRKAVA